MNLTVRCTNISSLVIVIRMCIIIIDVTSTRLVVLLPFRKAHPSEQRLQLICLVKNGFSVSEAGRRLGLPCSMAKSWAYSFLNDWEVGRCSRSSRSRVSTRREDQALHRACLKDLFHSAIQLKAVFCFPGCSRTVIHRLKTRFNIRPYRVATNETTTHAHAVDRHELVTGLFDCFDWTKVIYSDATTVSTDYGNQDTALV